MTFKDGLGAVGRGLWRVVRFIVVNMGRGLRALVRWIAVDRLRIAGAMLLLVIIGGYLLYRGSRVVRIATDPRNSTFVTWWTANEEERQDFVTSVDAPCTGAPFLLPADGYIGLLYGDPRGPYSELRPHQGIDIFSPGSPGETPIYAAYDGYISRLPEWTSSLIQRVPDDPLNPGRQIWLYYTHMANVAGTEDYIDDAFPPGTSEVFVERGTRLGFTGNYSGNPGRGVGVHLHFSVVLDDGRGTFLNELDFDNTVDPSAYLGIAVNYGCADDIPTCTPNPLCGQAVLGIGGS